MRSLIPWARTTGALEPLRIEMEDLFQRFFGQPDANGAAGAWAPRVDVEETEKEFIVKADLPGVDPKDVEITLAHGELTLKGEKKCEKETKEKNFHRIERFAGRFYRTIPLPVGTDPDKVTAGSAKGVITVTVPKKPEAQARKVAIQAAG